MGRRTLANDLASDIDRTFLNTDDFAIEITRNSKEGDTFPINAIWNELHADRSYVDGERGVRAGVMVISASCDVARGDQWTIDGEVWQFAPHEWLGSVTAGARTISLQKDMKVSTGASRGDIT